MIEHIRTVGLKGFDLDEDIPEKVIFTGKNKAGKSTRAGAIAIALYGHIPFSTAGKRPGDILDSFGDGKLLVSVVKIGGKEFGRKFSRNEKGVVSMVTQHEGKRTSKENFAVLLSKAGAPKIANTDDFMSQSETKKIDTLFDLFPNPELSTIDTEIHNWKEVVSRLQKKKDGADATVQRLTDSKQSIEIPAGTISATQEEIKTVETQISDLEKQIQEAEIEEAAEKAKEEGRIEGERLAKEKADKEEEAKYFEEDQGGMSKEDKEKEVCEAYISNDPQITYPGSSVVDPADPLEAEIQKGENQLENWKAGELEEPFQPGPSHQGNVVVHVDKATHPDIGVQTYLSKSNPADSIRRIIEALTGAGCGTCAALIVAKQELKKFKGVL